MNVRWNRAIAIVEMIGGMLGILVTISYLSGDAVDIVIVLITSVFVSLYVLSFIAGWLLWKNHPQGIRLSIVVQALQILDFNVPGLSYQFLVGLGMWLYVKVSQLPILGSEILFNLYMQYLSSWAFHINTEIAPYWIGLNFLALSCLIYLRGQHKGTARQFAQKSYLDQPTFVEEIDQIVQRRLTQSQFGEHSIQVHSHADGINIVLDGKVFGNPSEIEDIAKSELIQSAINEWESGNK